MSTSWGKVCISVVSRIRALPFLFRKGPRSATVHGVAQQVFSLQVDVGSTFVYDTTTKVNIQPDVYYVPRSGQQLEVALDSFYTRRISRRVSMHWAP